MPGSKANDRNRWISECRKRFGPRSVLRPPSIGASTCLLFASTMTYATPHKPDAPSAKSGQCQVGGLRSDLSRRRSDISPDGTAHVTTDSHTAPMVRQLQQPTQKSHTTLTLRHSSHTSHRGNAVHRRHAEHRVLATRPGFNKRPLSDTVTGKRRRKAKDDGGSGKMSVTTPLHAAWPRYELSPDADITAGRPVCNKGRPVAHSKYVNM